MKVPNDQKAPPTLPVLHFHTEAFQESERLDALNTFSRGLYSYNPANADGAAPRLDLDAWALDGIAAAALDYGPTMVQAPSRIDSSFQDMVFLRWVKSGRIRVECENMQREFGPGSLFLMQAQHRLHCLDDGASFSLRLPYDRIGADALTQVPIIALRTETWQVRVLLAALETLLEALPNMAISDVPAVADQVAALVRSVLQLDKCREETHHALVSNRALAMRRFLLMHLDRPNLGVRDLEAEFNASRATVYRAFDELGGVSNFVREHRLASIYRELRTSAPKRGVIRRIAEDYGLWDQTSFLRMFRAQYGVRPSEVLGTAHVCDVSTCNEACPGSHNLPNLAAFWRNAS